MKQPVGLLSGGQRQALTLLMATMVPPLLLLLDEHTAALDPATAEKVLELTKKIVAKNHTTCLMVTHNMQQALTMGIGCIMAARRVLLIASGADKADAIYKTVCGPITPECPASILQLHPDVVLVCDEAALSKLEGTGVEICG